MDDLLSHLTPLQPLKYFEAENADNALHKFAQARLEGDTTREAWLGWLEKAGLASDASCRELLESAKKVANRVVDGASERAKSEKMRPLDEDMLTALREHSLREALGREMERIASSQPSPGTRSASSSSLLVEDDTVIASPLGAGARFDALPASVVGELMMTRSSAPVSFRDSFLEPLAYSYWSPLLIRDVTRTLVKDGKNHRPLITFRDDSYFPALHAVSRLVAVLASEINLKTGSSFSYPNPLAEIWGVSRQGDADVSDSSSTAEDDDDCGLRLGYMFSSSSSTTTIKRELVFRSHHSSSSIEFKPDRLVLWRASMGLPHLVAPDRRSDADDDCYLMYLKCKLLRPFRAM